MRNANGEFDPRKATLRIFAEARQEIDADTFEDPGQDAARAKNRLAMEVAYYILRTVANDVLNMLPSERADVDKLAHELNQAIERSARTDGLPNDADENRDAGVRPVGFAGYNEGPSPLLPENRKGGAK